MSVIAGMVRCRNSVLLLSEHRIRIYRDVFILQRISSQHQQVGPDFFLFNRSIKITIDLQRCDDRIDIGHVHQSPGRVYDFCDLGKSGLQFEYRYRECGKNGRYRARIHLLSGCDFEIRLGTAGMYFLFIKNGTFLRFIVL